MHLTELISINSLQLGDIIRHKQMSSAMTIIYKSSAYAIAVRTAHVSQANEWWLCSRGDGIAPPSTNFNDMELVPSPSTDSLERLALRQLLEQWMDCRNMGVQECDREKAEPLFKALGLNVDDYI